MVAGLAWQVVSMTLFMALWADFAIRVHKARVQGYLKNSQSDDLAVLRDSKKFGLLQVGESYPAGGKCHQLASPMSKGATKNMADTPL